MDDESELKDELCFVQFIHPGKEGAHPVGGVSEWRRNEHPHARKFIETGGRCIGNGKKFTGPLRYWAEWEPESEAAEINDPVDHGPRYVHRPYYVCPPSFTDHRNTDPFVFGGFYYTLCQQHTAGRPTQLRCLARGSVILFGSCVSDQFVVDTVFVVAGLVDHDARDHEKLREYGLPDAFWTASLGPLYGDSVAGCAQTTNTQSYRLYLGATVDKPLDDGMFSYCPCMPASESPCGFARPAISIPDVITDGLLQGKRLNRGLGRQRLKEHWEDVRRQVESAGLFLGVATDVPLRRT